jgi:hypothetical protein
MRLCKSIVLVQSSVGSTKDVAVNEKKLSPVRLGQV